MPDLSFRTTTEGQPKVRRGRGGDLIVRTLEDDREERKFRSASHWARLDHGDPDKEAMYFVVTTGPAKLQTSSKGERKIEVDLPSGRHLRIFREGASFGVQNYSDPKNPDPTDHLYRLCAQDACHLAKFMDNVEIQPQTERIGELDDCVVVDQRPGKQEEETAPTAEPAKTEKPKNCPECAGPTHGKGYKHVEGCSLKK